MTRRADDAKPVRGWPEYALSWNYQAGEEVLVAVATNCAKAEILVNGRTVGEYALADYMDKGYIEVAVPFEEGEIVARCTAESGEVVATELKTAYIASALDVTADAVLPKDAIAHVEVDVVDMNGNPVPDAAVMVNVKVEGEGVLAGVENGDLADNTDYSFPGRRTRNGKLLVYVRGTGKAGKAVVTLTPAGTLAPVTIELDAE